MDRSLHGPVSILNSTPTHEETLEACERRLAIAPADAAAHGQAGMAYYALGRWSRGCAHLRVAVAAETDFAAAWSNLAFCHRSTGRIAESCSAASQSLAFGS